MMKKLVAVATLGLLFGCQSGVPFMSGGNFGEQDTGGILSLYTPSGASGVGTASTKIAMLVPLSGPSASIGNDLKNAGMMAGFDKTDSQAAVLFYDTKGTPAGVKEAYAVAMQESPDVIIGPVFSAEVAALKAEKPRVPVLSLTSDTAVVGDGIYTTALLIPGQVDRIVSFACESGQRKMAVLGPENKVGELTMNELSRAVKTCPGMEIKKVSLYDPKTVNFEPAIMKLAPKPVDARKSNLTQEERRLLNTPIKERVSFDSLLVFEEGIKLQQVMSLLSFYDVTPRALPVYGLSSWQNLKDNSLVGGYYPAMPTAGYQDFSARYQQNFGKAPVRIASMAYDSVSLSSLLGGMNNLKDTALTQPLGFAGVDGRVRLNPDGTNTRLLDMMQIKTRDRAEVVSPAPIDLPPRTNEAFWNKPETAYYEVDRTVDTTAATLDVNE